MADMHVHPGWDTVYEDWEDEILRDKYPLNGVSGVKDLLPNRSERSICGRVHKLGIRYMKYNANYFDIIDTFDKAYWLGFLYADGYVTSGNRWGMELSANDEYHVKNLLRAINANMNIKYRTRKSSFKNDAVYYTCGFQINNKKMYNDLIKWGVIRNKTDRVQFPMFLSDELLPHFIRGYYDGNGCSYCIKDKRNPAYYRVGLDITCGCEDFFITFKNVLYDKYKIDSRVRQKKEHTFALLIDRKDSVKRFIKVIYNNDNVCLDRKKEKCLHIIDVMP